VCLRHLSVSAKSRIAWESATRCSFAENRRWLELILALSETQTLSAGYHGSITVLDYLNDGREQTRRCDASISNHTPDQIRSGCPFCPSPPSVRTKRGGLNHPLSRSQLIVSVLKAGPVSTPSSALNAERCSKYGLCTTSPVRSHSHQYIPSWSRHRLSQGHGRATKRHSAVPSTPVSGLRTRLIRAKVSKPSDRM
jgi:hypothetical protein